MKDLHFHDLRGTAVARLALSNCSVPEIASITGHSMKTVQEILDAHYPGGRVELAVAGLVLAGVAVGACSSVIPYVCDQLAMSRVPRASFALMLALLQATATLIGVVVLAQMREASCLPLTAFANAYQAGPHKSAAPPKSISMSAKSQKLSAK